MISAPDCDPIDGRWSAGNSSVVNEQSTAAAISSLIPSGIVFRIGLH